MNSSKHNMRVVIVSPVGEIGGAEQVILKLAQLLPDYGVEPILACVQPGPLVERARQQGLSAFAFREHRLRHVPSTLQGVRWLAGLVRELKADLIHANFTAHVYASPAGIATGVPEVWHCYDYPHRPDLVHKIQLMLPFSHAIFATERVKSGFPGLLRRPHSVVAPVCLDADTLRAFPHQPGVRERYSLPGGPLFLTVARLQEHKGHRYLLQAIPAVLKHHPEAVFAIVGKAGSAEQQSYQEGLTALAVSLSITPQVRFLGYVPDADLASLYHEAAALVHPAVSEGYGLTLFEAMAMSVPVIAAAADGPAGIITHRENGLLVPTADSKSLAEAILFVADDAAVAETLRQGGRRFTERMTTRNMVEQTVDVYRKTLDASAKAPGTHSPARAE